MDEYQIISAENISAALSAIFQPFTITQLFNADSLKSELIKRQALAALMPPTSPVNFVNNLKQFAELFSLSSALQETYAEFNRTTPQLQLQNWDNLQASVTEFYDSKKRMIQLGMASTAAQLKPSGERQSESPHGKASGDRGGRKDKVQQVCNQWLMGNDCTGNKCHTIDTTTNTTRYTHHQADFGKGAGLKIIIENYGRKLDALQGKQGKVNAGKQNTGKHGKGKAKGKSSSTAGEENDDDDSIESQLTCKTAASTTKG